MDPNTLLVNVGNARGLTLKNQQQIDAFATLTLQGKGSMRSRVATETIQTEGHCRWDENLEFKMNDKSQSILVAVNHKTRLGSGELIGRCEIPLDQAQRMHGAMWFPLKKKKDDDKYRGEIQLQFTFSYEKPMLSISNMSLNKIEKEGVMHKMKRKMKLGSKHKQAEDTMSMASGFSVKSTKSNRFFEKLNKTFHGGSMQKSSTLPHSMLNRTMDEHEFAATADYLSPQGSQHDVSRPVSAVGAPVANGLGLNGSLRDGMLTAGMMAVGPGTVDETQPSPFSTPIGRSTPLIQHAPGTVSPSVSTAESFHRAGSIRSQASSGFGSSKPLKTEDRKRDMGTSQPDLLAAIDSLKLELHVKDARLKDMEEYMDNLITRCMEKCPDVLAAPLTPQKPKRRYF